MTSFRADWSRRANQDVDDIITFILKKSSGKAVLAFISRLEKAQDAILKNPEAAPFFDKSRNIRIRKIDERTALLDEIQIDHVDILRVYPYKKDLSRMKI